MSNQCDICLKSYVWPSDLKRHRRSKHKVDIRNKIHLPEQQQQQQQSRISEQQQQQQQYFRISEQQQQQQQYFRIPEQQQQQQYSRLPKQQQHLFFFKHPFTFFCCGPTSSGKSWFIKDLIENRNEVISPQPQKIYFFYSEWQDLYRQIAEKVPDIKFVRGIPDDIEDDRYFDPRVRNLAVFDDLMSDAASDKKIADIFTKKSHHRNLSVCLILQNLYKQGKVMRDISLNSQYMVLFKNPRDKQQISVLARQMYSGKAYKLLNMYESATERPYGYLLIDLKSDTPENRLKTNVLPSDRVQTSSVAVVHINQSNDRNELQHDIIESNTSLDEDKQVGTRQDSSVQVGTGLRADVLKKYAVKASLENGPPGQIASGKRKRMDSSQEHIFPYCDECGIMFAYEDDLRRHKLKRHRDDDSDSDDEPPRKKIKQEMPLKYQEHVWVERFRMPLSAKWVRKIKKRRNTYMQKGYSKEEAWDLARHDYIEDMRKDFRDMYTQFLLDAYYLDHDPVHKKMKETIDQLRWEHGMDMIEAIKQAVKTRKHLFNENVMPDPLEKKSGYQDAQVVRYDTDEDSEEELSEEESESKWSDEDSD